MNTTSQLLHEVAVTAIVVKNGKYLITRRTLTKKRFPGVWTVPGGKLETSDYVNLPKDTDNAWYNVLENVVRREVREEVGLEIKNIDYVISLATLDKDNAPLLVISCSADWASGEVVLQADETDQYAWISSDEAKDYKLIDGIDKELCMVDARRRGQKSEWKKSNG
ncbi:MAG: NUDIX domain-containing protein [bacterium]|nr:NUDIX domain-containing protein [bacterium]